MLRFCKKCGGPLGPTHNGPANCIHGVSMKKHCCECGKLWGKPTPRIKESDNG